MSVNVTKNIDDEKGRTITINMATVTAEAIDGIFFLEEVELILEPEVVEETIVVEDVLTDLEFEEIL